MKLVVTASKKNLVHVIMEVKVTQKDLLCRTNATLANVRMVHGNVRIECVQVMLEISCTILWNVYVCIKVSVST